MILKTYTNSITKQRKPLHLDIEKEFENDNYLIQTLKRTSKFKNDKKLSDYEKSLQDLLYYINDQILFNTNPKIKRIHDENEEFLKPYKYLSKTFEAQTEQVLKDLIIMYTKKGYRIPKFSYKNNIFKINALIEENDEKLRLMLLEEYKKKQNIIGPKTLSYLNKINILIKILLTKDNNLIKKYNKLLNKKEAKSIKKETIEQLKTDIENLISLINTIKINTYDKIKRKSSFLAVNHYNNFNRLLNSKNSSLNELLIYTSPTKNKNIENNSRLSTEERKSVIKERSPHGFLSVRIDKNEFQSNKLISSMNTKQVIKPFEKIQRLNTVKNVNQKNIFFKKSKPVKMKSFFARDQIERLKSENNQSENESDNENKNKKKRKNTYSDLGKYINQAKKNKPYQSDKYSNKYLLGLKKNNDNIKRNHFLTNKYLGYSFDKSFKKTFSKKFSEEKGKDLSRNYNHIPNLKKLNTGQTEILDEKRSKFLNNAYNKIRKGKYEYVEDYMRKYLKDIKDIDPKEEETIMKYYNYKNLKNNLLELNMKVNDEKTRKKIEKIYSGIHILKRIKPILNNMKDKENNIDRLEKIFSSGVHKYN